MILQNPTKKISHVVGLQTWHAIPGHRNEHITRLGNFSWINTTVLGEV